MKKLTIFDVCGTLVDANSTYDYINFLIKKGIKKHYKLFFLKRYVWIFYYSLNILFKKDFKIEVTKKFMKGLKKKDLEKFNKEFFEWYETKFNKNIFEKLLDVSKKEDTILLSASINPPIDYLKGKYNLKGFSSLLEEKNGEYTGNLVMGLWGKKEKVFKEKLFDIEKYSEIEFYTDNEDDISLINYFQTQKKNLKIYIIPYNNKRYWKDYFNKSKVKYEFLL